MGVEVVAYRGLKRLHLGFDLAELDEGDIPAHHSGLEAGSVYCFEEVVTVWSGSGRDLDLWHGRLEELVASHGGRKPFRGLIDPRDDQDVIRSWTAARLARDFKEWEDRAKDYGVALDDPGFHETYAALRRGFEIAADRGAVEFC